MMLRLVLVLVLTLFGSMVCAQVTPTPGGPPKTAAPTTPTPTEPVPVPKEYTAAEFPDWALSVRRAEILTIGALPVTSLFAGLGFDYVYYLANGTPASNIPWPLGPGTSGWTTSGNASDLAAKNLTIVATSVGLALAIAGGDWLLGLLLENPSP